MSDSNSAKKALIADPSSHMATLVMQMLYGLKIKAVEVAIDLDTAKSLLQRKPFDLILIDEELGGADGLQLIRSMRQTEDHLNRTSPIIMMAATPSAESIKAARDAGINEFLRKPFSAQHIQMRLNSMQNAPRPFVESDVYAGPDRRRRSLEVGAKRRASDEEAG